MQARLLNLWASVLTLCLWAASAGGQSVDAAKAANNEPAAARTEASYTFQRGITVAHWLSRMYEPDWPYAGAWFNEEDVGWIAAQGFDHIRVPVDGYYWLDAQGKLLEERIKYFDAALGWAKRHRLGVVLTMVGLPSYRVDWLNPTPPGAPTPLTDAKLGAEAEQLWRLIAQRYADVGDGLRFEALLQPEAPDTGQIAAFQKKMLAAIRASSPKRVVYLSPLGMSVDRADAVPLADPHTALALDFFEPRIFTLQRSGQGARPLVSFPGKTPDFEAFVAEDPSLRGQSGVMLTVADLDAQVARIAAWAQRQPRKPELYIAEFGVQESADDASARNYIQAVRAAFERHGIAWAVYCYQHGGLAVRDPETDKPTRILEGLRLGKAH